MLVHVIQGTLILVLGYIELVNSDKRDKTWIAVIISALFVTTVFVAIDDGKEKARFREDLQDIKRLLEAERERTAEAEARRIRAEEQLAATNNRLQDVTMTLANVSSRSFDDLVSVARDMLTMTQMVTRAHIHREGGIPTSWPTTRSWQPEPGRSWQQGRPAIVIDHSVPARAQKPHEPPPSSPYRVLTTPLIPQDSNATPHSRNNHIPVEQIYPPAD